MAITYKKISYKTFGEVLAITNGTIDLYVTLDCGPRVIRYGFCGGENFMFEDVDAQIVEKSDKFDTYFYKDAYWRTYGGHRLWLTPEAKPETYYPDNDPVEYSVSGNVFTFTPPAQRANLVQESFVISVDETGTGVAIEARATNVADHAQKFGIWQVTVMCKNGLAIVPQTLTDTVLLHNRTMSLWPYTDMSDDRVCWGKELITLRQDPGADHPIKIGITNTRGFVGYACHDALFVKSFAYYPGVNYPDDGCNFETYTNPHFLELESLGKLENVAPGDTVTGVERWELVPDVKKPCGKDMAALEKLVADKIGK